MYDVNNEMSCLLGGVVGAQVQLFTTLYFRCLKGFKR
jgi:hypothetical protein